jgi:hypothetical protein
VVVGVAPRLHVCVREVKEKKKNEGQGVVIWVQVGAVVTLPFWFPHLCLWATTTSTTRSFLMGQLPECQTRISSRRWLKGPLQKAVAVVSFHGLKFSDDRKDMNCTMSMQNEIKPRSEREGQANAEVMAAVDSQFQG